MDASFVESLHGLLVQTIAPDTALLKAATAQLNQEYYKNPACIPALAAILVNSPEQSVRQLAAVELRKRVAQNSNSLWLQVNQSNREEIKSNLPPFIIGEPSKLVQHSAARVIAAIASIEIPQGRWKELIPSLRDICSSSNTSHREVGSFILYTVLDNTIADLERFFPELFDLYTELIIDAASLEVRITTVRSLGTIAQYIEADHKTEIKAFRSLLPSIIQVIGHSVEAGDEAGARHLFDVLDTLLIVEAPILSRHIPELTHFLLQCSANRNFLAELRVLALNCLSWTVQYKKSKLQSQNLAHVILEGLMPITTEDEPEDADDDAPCRAALRIIDGLATNLPPSQVFPALRQLILQYFTSSDPSHRRGAILALGISVEGCSEYMTPLMHEVWPVIEAGLRDPDATVRKATCIAVGCLCEWLEEQCASKHEILLPSLMNLIDDPITQKPACTALDGLLEVLHGVIDIYLPLIMDRLGVLLTSAPIGVKAVVTGAIGSAAHASKEQFLPYFDPTMALLEPFLGLKDDGEVAELRGIAMDAIGTFSEAVGKEAFRKYAPKMMQHAFEGLEMGSARLRECSFLFFGVMARVFEDEFAIYLDKVVPPLLDSCKQLEHGEETNEVIDLSAFVSDAGSSPTNAIAVSDENGFVLDVEDLDIDKTMMDVNSAIAVEKEIAADTIGTIFAATKNHFLPYVEECVSELIVLLGHYYEGIRKSATDSLLEVVRTFYDLSDHEKWTPGFSTPNKLSPQVTTLIQHAMMPLIEMYDTEDNKSVVASLCVGLAETINDIGPDLVQPYFEHLRRIATQILEQKSFCQKDPDHDEQEEQVFEEQAEYDSVLVSSAGDLVSALANATGPDFAPYSSAFLPQIANYFKPTRSTNDRAAAIGCLAEIISGLKGSVTPHTSDLLELFSAGLRDPEAEVLSNAAFAIGILVENTDADLSNNYAHILILLRPLFNVNADTPATSLNAKDNATGAVARLILKHPEAIPFDDVLPIFLHALPLKNDYLENRPVFNCIFGLFKTRGAVLLPYIDHLLSVFAYVVGSETNQVNDEIRSELIHLLVLLRREFPDKIQALGLNTYLPEA